jgi:hypothetical protein
MDYPGKVITKTQVTPTQTSATGVWTLDDAAAATRNNNWPVAGVPNPISKSLRFNSADTTYLNRTLTTPTNNKIFTYSVWVKRSGLGASQTLFDAFVPATSFDTFRFNSSDQLDYFDNTAGYLTSTQVFRDPSSWYHVMAAVDTTQATSSNRVKLYVNGVQITAFSATAYPSQNQAIIFNSAVAHNIGRFGYSANAYINGYMTEINFIDGQALTPSSFGMTNPQTGQWIPLKYSGTYGTNGFYLNFKDATSTTTLGYDYSGNANNWTTNNFSVTAGSGNDSLTDVPTPWFAYNTTGDVGGVIRGNYCTMNPLNAFGFASGAISNGNLNIGNGNGSVYAGITSTMRIPTTVPIYAEFTVTALGLTGPTIGITSNSTVSNTAGRTFGDSANDWVLLTSSGNKENNNSSTSYGTGFSANDIGMLAVDTANGKVWFGKNGTWFNSGVPASGTNAAFTNVSGEVYVGEENDSDDSAVWNFGQRPFAYTPPAGFRSLCTTNLPATTIGFGLTNQGDDYFNPVLYTGNGTSQTISTGLQPDFIWIKRINGAAAHTLTDSVRGISKQLFSNLTDAEQTDADSGVTAISSSSITLGDNNLAVGSVNGSGSTYVAWNWKASGSTVSNTAGTITSTVSANTTAGFSIVTYTGTGSAATVGHGLGVAPNMIIVKNRTNAGQFWAVGHSSLTSWANGVYLNSTAAQASATTLFNSTAPTSTVFSVGTSGDTNGSTHNMVAYVFAAVPGYSAFGSYTGNGSADGPFVYLGFRPEFVMVKRTDTAGNEWEIRDAARDPYNSSTSARLWANSSAAELNDFPADLLSNGFKPRSTGTNSNGSGATYIYMAFAEFPFQFANAR